MPSPDLPPPIEEEIFQVVVALPIGERAAYLEAACEGRPEVRASVEGLLAAHDDDGFMQRRADRTVSPELEAEFARLKPEEDGERIGNYHLLQQIGEGGFGTVWMAEQEQPVRRRVALKIIKLGMDTKEVIARFEQERQALAMMDHPNIAKVFDAGATQFGRPYFVMELVKGIPITQFCDEQQLGIPKRLALFEDACSAISHAHQKGIIHRDIKPSNVMVTLHGDKAVVKVIDFGIAKATLGKLTDKTLFTRFEQFIGTPVYMSPEQAALSGLDIDTRSDIYALGILLYELLTGTPPFDAKSLASAGYEEMRRIIREVEPPKPSSRLGTASGDERTTLARARQIAPEKLSRLVEPDLDWIVMKAIEKDRTRRYETANGLALDIQRFLADEPVSATPPSAIYKFRKFARRNKTALSVGMLIAVVLVAATGVSLWQAKVAIATAKSERLAREESEAITQFLTGLFESPDPSRIGRNVTVAEILGTAAKKLAIDLATQPARRAHLQSTLGETYQALGRAREAIPLHEAARTYYLGTLGPGHRTTLAAGRHLATSYFDAGRLDEALKLREEGFALSRKVLGPEDPDTLAAMIEVPISYFDAGRRQEALKMGEELLKLRQKVSGAEHSDTLGAMNNLAFSYSEVGRKDEALKLREDVLAVRLRANGPEHPDTLSSINNLANSYSEVGRKEDALKLREEVLPVYRKVLGPEHPRTLDAISNLSLSYAETGRKDDALRLLEEVLADSRRLFGPEHPDTLMAMINLSNFYTEAGRNDDALKMKEEVLALRQKALGPEHPDTLVAMGNLGLSYSAVGRWREALKVREELLTLRRKVNGPENRNTLFAMGNVAVSYARAGRMDDAIKLQEEMLPLSRKVLGPEHPDTLRSQIGLAGYYAATGHADDAIKLLEEVLPLLQKVNGPEHSDTLNTTESLALSYMGAGLKEKGLKLQEEVFEKSNKVLGPEHRDTLRIRLNLADSYAAGDRPNDALKLREEGLPLFLKVYGPEHPQTLTAMFDLADSCFGAGRRDNALELREEVLKLRRKIFGPQHPATIGAMTVLAESYDADERKSEAKALRDEVEAVKAKRRAQ